MKMFRLAQHKVAVDNAKPVLKEYATEIIGTNEEDSVVKYIMDKCRWDRP
ncbi:MAG: HAD hydrolase family protein [Firmicutes bacterium]|nr:HAD hydrolase family protein [Bacillota bacterium]